MNGFSHFFKFSSIALTVIMMACSKDDSKSEESPVLSVTPAVRHIQFLAEGQTIPFTVETNRATWEVNSSDPSWLTATKSGNGLILTAEANNTESERTATVTVSATGVTPVTLNIQQPNIPVASPTLSITPAVTDLQFSATGDVVTSNGNSITPTFTVETNRATWEVNSSAPSWLTATKSETDFTLTVTANNTSSDRTATVTVSAGTASVTINVRQKKILEYAGLWLFDDPADLTKAAKGANLVAVGTDIVPVTGPSASNGAVRVPKGSHFIAAHGIPPTAGQSGVSEYTLMIDFKIPNLGTWYSFLQTDRNNSNDGEFFINTAGRIGVGTTGYSETTATPNVWQRLVITVNIGVSGIKYYLDGNEIHSSNTTDSRFLLDEVMLLLGDEDGDDGEFDVAEVALWDVALSAEEVTALGQVR